MQTSPDTKSDFLLNWFDVKRSSKNIGLAFALFIFFFISSAEQVEKKPSRRLEVERKHEF